MKSISVEDVQVCMAPHIPLYRWHRPVYQHAIFESLLRLWGPNISSALDVGGGTGIMAQTAKTIFGLSRVVSVDIHDRFLKTLDVETQVYDGKRLPYPDASFDCILLFNVLHHVPVSARPALMAECRRVAGSGPIFIKDHLSGGFIDDALLGALDFIGNTPFKGMIWAKYLRRQEWQDIADFTSCSIVTDLALSAYRKGLSALVFPNRLEVTMRWQVTELHG